ncbi:MAG: glycosyltransferase family 2 protein [Planctomycetota bacterium]|nr:glycosyltransferase family 2 protein [Planctomycetota bacterium]
MGRLPGLAEHQVGGCHATLGPTTLLRMKTLALSFLIYYTAVLAVIGIYGLHRYWLVWVFWRSRRRRGETEPTKLFERLPRVTVQLPMFNERHVAKRVIEAACAIDYPRDLLEIQVLDDSTDESAQIAQRHCAQMAAAGHDVRYIHRTNRAGFKAGALANGLKSAKGEFIAVFDADFVPPTDILPRTRHQFSDPQIGMVQTRWAHLNRDDSILTQVQAMVLDGHFIVEQTARASTGRWFNFNGTAGIWRASCIEDAGGWQHDTLTEDTDLSYRAQLNGWRFKYLGDVTCPAEVPPTVSAFIGQQHRWNKGLTQTAIKLLPRIMRSDAPLATKVEAFFHLTAPVPYVAVLLLVVLALPALFVATPLYEVRVLAVLSVGSLCLVLGTVAACTFCVVSQCAQKISFWRTILRLPALMAIGVGINVLNTKATIEALLGRQSPFVRTPKYAGGHESDPDPVLNGRRRRIPSGLIELGLAGLMLACVAISISRPYVVVGVPFLLLFAAGYLAIGVPSLRQSFARRPRSRISPT